MIDTWWQSWYADSKNKFTTYFMYIIFIWRASWRSLLFGSKTKCWGKVQNDLPYVSGASLDTNLWIVLISSNHSVELVILSYGKLKTFSFSFPLAQDCEMFQSLVLKLNWTRIFGMLYLATVNSVCYKAWKVKTAWNFEWEKQIFLPPTQAVLSSLYICLRIARYFDYDICNSLCFWQLSESVLNLNLKSVMRYSGYIKHFLRANEIVHHFP